MVFALAFLAVVSSAMQVLIIPILGQLGPILRTTSGNAAWAVTVTPLVSAVVVTVSGRLGDMMGKRRVIVGVTVPMVVGLAVCATATSLPAMLIGRGLQGVAVGVVPLAISLLRDALPPMRLGSAVAVVSASLGIGNALGLPLAAAIAQVWSWHTMFWAFAALAVVGLALVLVFVPSRTSENMRTSVRFDYRGALILAVGLVCLLLPVSKGADWGWASARTVGLFVAAVVVVALWVLAELRHPAPLTDLRTLARKTVAWTNIASVLVTFAMYTQFLVLPQILELARGTGYGLGQSMLGTALWYGPCGLFMLVVAPLTARLERRFGAHRVMVTACLALAVAYAVSPLFIKAAWGVLVVTCLIQAGLGLALGVIPVLLMSDAPVEQTAAVNGFNMLARNIGTATAGAVLGAVLSTMTVPYQGGTVPSLAGFHTALFLGGGAALVGALCSAFIPARRGASR
jgi:predicted MFS family arabinose efflux permease